MFIGIKDDVAKARSAVIAGYKRNRLGGLKNAVGKTIDVRAKPAQKLAHLIQGVEVQALHAALTLYPSEIQLIQHDGFVAGRDQLDRVAITEAVFATTGYRLNLEEERIWIDFGTQFLK